MKPLHDLAAQLTLGTERRPPAFPQLSGAFGELIAAACPADGELEVRLLRLAGALAVGADTGYAPPELSDEAPACPAEDLRPVTDPALASALRRILADGPDALRQEALRRLAANAMLLPPGLLPQALTLARKTPALRAALLPVLGQRGRWLAKLRKELPLIDDSPFRLDQWENGTLDQRQTLLRQLRESDPERARSLLGEGFADLDARERASLLEQLAVGLSPADEDFLEAALADRSKEVRQLAANLLARLPASRYGERMAARLSACLGRERKLFRQVIVLEAPEKFGADWKNDAIDESRAKSESLGERAWWLYQLARAVPLAWWQTQTGMTPAELVRWLPATDWSESILRAWSEALRRQPDAQWAAALLACAARPGLSLGVFELLAFLPLAEREQHWLRMLEAGPEKLSRGELLGQITKTLDSDRAELSPAFVDRLLNEIRSTLYSESGHVDYALSGALPEFVCRIPVACLGQASRGWPAQSPLTGALSDSLARALAIIELRTTLDQSLR